MWETHKRNTLIHNEDRQATDCTAQRGCALFFLGGFPKTQPDKAQGNLVWPHG